MNFLIEIAAYVCECVTLLLCIHSFLGKKIRLDYKTILLIVADVTTLMIIHYFQINKLWTFINQVFIFVYIRIKFKVNLRENIILLVINIFVNTAIQAIATVPTYLLLSCLGYQNNNSMIVFAINLISLILMWLFMLFIRVNDLYLKIIKWDKIIMKILIGCAIISLYLIVEYKTNIKINVREYFTNGILVSIVIFVLFYWQKEKFESRKKDLEIHMHQLYGKAFEGMVENIRIRQHDFKNQLSAIYSMHLTAGSLEDLVKEQQEYCNHLVSESKYDGILTKCSDKILAGFLYTKISEIESLGVEIDFEIVVSESEFELATYEIIEIIGILLDNAAEHEIDKTKKIYFKMTEENEKLHIVCRNISEYISMENAQKFFQKNFSTKGQNRGLGLYHVRRLLENKGEITVTNKTIEDCNWLEFIIEIKVKK